MDDIGVLHRAGIGRDVGSGCSALVLLWILALMKGVEASASAEVLRDTVHFSIRGGRDGRERNAIIAIVAASGSGLRRGL